MQESGLLLFHEFCVAVPDPDNDRRPVEQGEYFG
jgi:hypothetical protein